MFILPADLPSSVKSGTANDLYIIGAIEIQDSLPFS